MQATDTVIRPATAGDLGAVAAIFGHYVRASVVTFEVADAGQVAGYAYDLTAAAHDYGAAPEHGTAPRA